MAETNNASVASTSAEATGAVQSTEAQAAASATAAEASKSDIEARLEAMEKKFDDSVNKLNQAKIDKVKEDEKSRKNADASIYIAGIKLLRNEDGSFSDKVNSYPNTTKEFMEEILPTILESDRTPEEMECKVKQQLILRLEKDPLFSDPEKCLLDSIDQQDIQDYLKLSKHEQLKAENIKVPYKIVGRFILKKGAKLHQDALEVSGGDGNRSIPVNSSKRTQSIYELSKKKIENQNKKGVANG